jgi:hypothetical protein
MGHYYSEMVSQKELDAEAKWKHESVERVRALIREHIEEKGLDWVLAQIVLGEADYWKYHYPKEGPYAQKKGEGV